MFRPCFGHVTGAILVAPQGTVDVAEAIQSFTAKMHISDPARVNAAIAHYEPHIDFERLLG